MKRYRRFVLLNEFGRGLHYVQGTLIWRKPTSWEALENLTSFQTRKEAIESMTAWGLRLEVASVELTFYRDDK